MTTEVHKAPRKMRPFSLAWQKSADLLALTYAPRVGACVKCKQPCLAGYCCGYCGGGEGCLDEEGSRLR